VKPADLTAAIVRAAFPRLKRYRDASYLCRAYLQFGPEAMADEHLEQLCQCIDRVNGE
jgi:hypothetical protein